MFCRYDTIFQKYFTSMFTLGHVILKESIEYELLNNVMD